MIVDAAPHDIDKEEFRYLVLKVYHERRPGSYRMRPRASCFTPEKSHCCCVKEVLSPSLVLNLNESKPSRDSGKIIYPTSLFNYFLFEI